MIRRCLQLADYGDGYVAPNPKVGAVLVYQDEIIGEGFHRKYGEPHAEPNAINSVKIKELISESTLYVNLEPCSHYGKTPPCADLIVRSGIPRVVIGTLDPNPKVSGRGIEILEKAGVVVISGVLENECRELNKRFFTYQEKKRPYIILKWAQTSDGFIDIIRKDNSVTPLKISNSVTSQLTHKYRSENQSILVGSNTVLLDNPSLTVRNWSGKSPDRIILNRAGNIPPEYNIFDVSANTIIFTSNPGENTQHASYIKIDFAKENLKDLIQRIYNLGIHSVLVEGGAKVLNSFIEAGLWDEANVEVSQQTCGNGVKAPEIKTQPVNFKLYDNHRWILYKNSQNP